MLEYIWCLLGQIPAALLLQNLIPREDMTYLDVGEIMVFREVIQLYVRGKTEVAWNGQV